MPDRQPLSPCPHPSVALLTALEAAGLRLSVRGGKLLVEPAGKLPEALRTEIRQYRDDLFNLVLCAQHEDALARLACDLDTGYAGPVDLMTLRDRFGEDGPTAAFLPGERKE